MKIKVDLHLHSYASKQNGDSIKWDSVHDSVSRLYNSGVRLAAFSDHNIFDVELYLECSQLGKTGGMVFLPAIEANVVRKNGVIANLIYVFAEDLPKEKLLEIRSITKKEMPKRGITIEKANNLFNEYDVLRIPHIGKSDFFNSDDLKDLKFDAFEVTNLTHPNYLQVLKAEWKESVVAFSDTHIWKKYPQQGSLITEMEMDSIGFQGLKKKLQERKNFTKGINHD